MRYMYITKRQIEKSRDYNKEGNIKDISRRKERSRQDGPVIEMNGKELHNLLVKNNIQNPEFINEFLPFAFAPSGDENEYCLQWMQSYFHKFGDKQPDSYITYLSEAFKRDIYDQYTSHIKEIGVIGISRDSFYRMWVNCFPYCMLRDECNIIGKCKVCAKSSEMRMSKNVVLQEQGKDLHMLHRITFKGERCAYQSRIEHALEKPNTVMSVLIDIMEACQCQSPNAGSQYKFTDCFDSCIVGAYVHGNSSNENKANWKRLRIYRTWNSVGKCASLIIHVFLKTLEEWITLHDGNCPDLIYLQVDGGGENANNPVLSMLQLITSLNCCSNLVFSRLPTGHGHTDGDGGFGVIKVIIKNAVLAAWDSFENEVLKRLGEGLSTLNCSFENVYLINDWESYIKPYMCKFSALHKMELTQHQILFQRVENDMNYPLGVKVSVRQYCCQKVIVFNEVSDRTQAQTELGVTSGYDPVSLLVKWFSVGKDGNTITFLNDTPPTMQVPFHPLIENCVGLVDHVLAEIQKTSIPIITRDIKEGYQIFRERYLPYESDVNNLVSYARRIAFSTPMFALFETNAFPYSRPGQDDVRVTSFNDEDFNKEYDILYAVSIPSVGISESRTRAYKVPSQLAADITTKVIGTSEFKRFLDHVQVKHKQYATFYGEECKYSYFGSIKYVKAKVVSETNKAVSNYLTEVISRLYTPLLDSFVKSLESKLGSQTSDVIVEYKHGRRKDWLYAKDLKVLGVKALNALMHLFNTREDGQLQMYKSNDKEYTKNYFNYAETIVDVFTPTKCGQFAALEVYSKVIFPYRAPFNGKHSINLIVMIPKQNKVLFLDLVRSRVDAKRLLPSIKTNFDRYYSKNFTVELYSTIPEASGIVDSFQRLGDIQSDEPTIYMYVAIYYVLFGCPIIFDASDINIKNFQDKIKLSILQKNLLL